MATVSTALNNLLHRLRQDFPHYQFQPGEIDSWSPKHKTITFRHNTPPAYLLHELAHAELGHSTFTRDVALLEMERDAWHHAVSKLAPKYGIRITMDDDIVQDALDTYRQWLSSRSSCPRCGAIGLQASSTLYRCLNCQGEWRVNEARTCRLRRTKL